MGWGELWGIADRTDYDLSVHEEHSKTELKYLDPETNEKYVPYVIEPSVGVDRLLLAIISDGYKEEEISEYTKLPLEVLGSISFAKNNLVFCIDFHTMSKISPNRETLGRGKCRWV